MTLGFKTRALLLASATLAPASAFAQDAASAASAASPSADQGQAAVAQDPAPTAEDVVVTGSRIQRPDYEAPNPIVSFDAAKLQGSGNTNVTTFLQRVPALTNSLDSTRTAGTAQSDGDIAEAGLNLLDLRGLGPERTLVLVNGRRHVAGQINTAAVDINSIPTDLIERVDVLTGPASAVYGADAVSGAVNFILKRDFDGLSARTQVGISQRGDAGNRFASIVAGRNFADDRANVTLAYEYYAEDPLANDDRSYLRSANRQNFVNIDNYDPTRAGSYQKGPLADIRYGDSSPYGYVDIAGVRYRGDGALYQRGTPLQNDYFTLGGDDTPVAGYIGDIFPRTRRHDVNLLTRFDASDAFKLSLEGKFVQTTAHTLAAYSGTYSSGQFYQPFSLDNPFIPASIRDAALAAGLTAVDLNRNNFDLPRRGEEDRRRTWRGVVDATGAISDHARYDVYYTYGRTDLRATKLNDRLGAEFAAALDAVSGPAGQIVCRSAAARAAGCLPINPFGAATADANAFDYFLFNPVSRARIEQHVVDASVSGDFGQFFSLPGGPVQFAFGGEYRREKTRFRPAQELTDNIFYEYDESIIPGALAGSFDVWEAFGELNVPLLKDQPFAQVLSVGAAGRYSDYSTVGGTSAYQFNGVWSPIRDITFRGSYGQSVRAPNIGELYQATGSGVFISDPCYLSSRNDGTQYRAANCAALISAAGGDPAAFTSSADPFASIYRPGLSRGNPDLREETARTWTAGVVLRPRFVPGLQVAADWYDIRIRNAISTASATRLAELCVDLPTTDNVFCGFQTRQAGTGYINSFIQQPSNVASFRTAGLDLSVTYVVNTARLGRFDLRLVGNYLDKLTQIPTPGAVAVDNRDQPFRPKYSATFSPSWKLDPITINYNLRWQNGVRRFERVATDDNPSFVDPRYFRFKELWQHDVQVDIAATDRFSFYTGVNNIGDQKPDIGFETNVPISPVGRFFYAGARINLPR